MSAPRFRLGVDLGGTKIEILALDPLGGERFRQRVPTPQGDYAATLRAIATLVESAERTLGASGSVGIGTATPVNKLSVAGGADFAGRVGIGVTIRDGAPVPDARLGPSCLIRKIQTSFTDHAKDNTA